MIGNRLPATTKGKNKPKDWLLAFLIKDLSRPEKCKLSNVMYAKFQNFFTKLGSRVGRFVLRRFF